MSEQIRGLAYDPYGIGGVLSNWRLRVPPNQRDYMWGKDEVDDLFLDLSSSIGPGGSPQYFLGTIVTIPQGGDLLEVVDGQQRLATITILCRRSIVTRTSALRACA